VVPGLDVLHKVLNRLGRLGCVQLQHDVALGGAQAHGLRLRGRCHYGQGKQAASHRADHTSHEVRHPITPSKKIFHRPPSLPQYWRFTDPVRSPSLSSPKVTTSTSLRSR